MASPPGDWDDGTRDRPAVCGSDDVETPPRTTAPLLHGLARALGRVVMIQVEVDAEFGVAFGRAGGRWTAGIKYAV
ncbi:hypothetical protein LX36DRAFT_716498 [Colletotrichum falcatum]|nr:hypothetical protein LX36DRAFT_716498 [Colletotrichum falcatum]